MIEPTQSEPRTISADIDIVNDIDTNTDLMTAAPSVEGVGNLTASTGESMAAIFRDMVEHSPDAIVVHRHGCVLYGNRASAAFAQTVSCAAVVGSHLVNWIHESDRELLARQLASVGSGVHMRSECAICRLAAADGTEQFVEVESALLQADGEHTVQTVLRDVTARVRNEQQLHHQAFHDMLTGLSNRALYLNRVEHALSRLTREGSPRERVVALLLDLDHFKSVNDGFGHANGDALLGAVAGRLLAATRGCDTVARLSGDEFAVLLDDVASEADSTMVAERIVRAMRAPFKLNGVSVVVGASVGVASAVDADSADALLRNADLALYAAKAAGRGRQVRYARSMHDAAVERLAMESELRCAVDRLELTSVRNDGELRLMYQPIIDLSSGQMTGVEALLRWTRPGHGAVMPAAFLPVAEESALIVPLGTWVLHHACRQAVAWERFGKHGRIAIGVNISRRQFQEPDFLDVVRSALTASKLEPSRLMLEITEELMMDDEQLTLSRLRALREIGVRVAVDDFGTGYTSLSYLQQFPVDFLKIDRRFIRSAGDGADDSVIANAIVNLGTAFSLSTIAEGIETVGQLEHLRALGCEHGQGYLFAHPLSAEDVGERLLLAGLGRN